MNEKKSKQIRKSAEKLGVEKWIEHPKFGKVLNPAWKRLVNSIKADYLALPRNQRRGWIEEKV